MNFAGKGNQSIAHYPIFGGGGLSKVEYDIFQIMSFTLINSIKFLDKNAKTPRQPNLPPFSLLTPGSKSPPLFPFLTPGKPPSIHHPIHRAPAGPGLIINIIKEKPRRITDQIRL